MSTAPAAGTAAHDAAGREYLRVVVIAALIGIPAALVAAAFLGAVHLLQQWLWTELPAQLGYAQLPWFIIIGLPAVGALLVVVARRFLPGDGGAEPLGGLAGERPTPLSYAPGVVLAAIGTLAFGAVLGPEMPVIALGSVVGMTVNQFVSSIRANQQCFPTPTPSRQFRRSSGDRSSPECCWWRAASGPAQR